MEDAPLILETDTLKTGYPKLNQAINNANEALTKATSAEAKADSAQEQIGQVVKGIYSTLSDLQTAYPTGTTGKYLVAEDGKWYYWNGSAWTVGGAYQLTGLSIEQVKKSNLEKPLQNTIESVGYYDDSKIPSITDFSLIVGATLTTVTNGVKATLSANTYSWAALSPEFSEIEWDFDGAQWYVFGANATNCTAVGLTGTVTGRVLEVTPTSYTQLIAARSDYSTSKANVGDRIRMKIDNTNKTVTLTIKRAGTSSFVDWMTFDMSPYTCTFKTNPRLGLMAMSFNSPSWTNMKSVYNIVGQYSDYPTTKSDFYNFKNDRGPQIDDLQTLSDGLYEMSYPPTRDFVNYAYTDGQYWTTTNGVAAFTPYAGYAALNDLVPCNPGDTLHLKNWGDTTPSGAIAYSAYDNDRKPYNGSSSRINWDAGTYDAATNTYSFVIPANCTLIGLSIKYNATYPKSAGVATIGDTKVVFTDEMNAGVDERVIAKVNSLNIETDISADYFQKGASVKTLTKNIGIIAAGQSNIDGRVPSTSLPSYITYPIANCNYASGSNGGSNGTFQNGMNLGTGNWAFDTVTYWNLTQTAGKTIYVMKYSMGGTSIDPTGDNTYHWTADYEKLSSISNSLLWSFESLIRACVASQGTNFDVRAMLWHQGEGDRNVADKYYDNLKYLIAYCRGIVGNKRLPFITGTISHNSAQYNATIEAAQQKIASEDPYFYLVDMSGATLLDSYHFDAASSEYFGKMCYDKLIDAGVISGTKLNPTRPW